MKLIGDLQKSAMLYILEHFIYNIFYFGRHKSHMEESFYHLIQLIDESRALYLAASLSLFVNTLLQFNGFFTG